MKKLICCLALLGCVNGCAQTLEHAAYIALEDVPPEPKLIPIQFGQTIEVAAPEMFVLHTSLGATEIPLHNFYQFTAEPGQAVTITMRSRGGDTSVRLLDSIGHSNVKDIAHTTSERFDEAGRKARLRGEHSELIVTLPDDEDGVYYIHPFNAKSGFSLTLQAGAVPAQDILQEP